MTFRLFGLAGLAGALILTGCSTVDSRISEHPDIFQTLSANDQALVSRGQIRSGMSDNAAWLAWGSPDQKVVGNMRGRNTETWLYTTTTSYGYGYGPYGYGYGYGGGPYGYPFYGGFGFRGVVHAHHGRRFVFYGDPFYDPFFYSYIPTVSYPYKTVTFSNGRVVSFQYLSGSYR